MARAAHRLAKVGDRFENNIMKMMDFALNLMDFALKMMDLAFKTTDFDRFENKFGDSVLDVADPLIPGAISREES